MSNKRIMVVDDSRVVYAEMQKMLKDSEIEIAAFCRTGEEALERYEEVKPDVVTMDIVMSGMDGLETCQKLKERWPDACVLMVSSMAYTDMVDRAASMGAKGFLFKPFTQESLLGGLRGVFKTLKGAEDEKE